MPLLELKSLSKQYPGHLALDGLSLEIEKGELFALLGPSGCGKTTTLRLIAGFDQPTSGEILLGGVPITHLAPYQRNVNTVFQNYALFPHMTAQANIEFGLRQKRANGIEDKVRRMFEMIQLAGKESRKPSELSGGERQRVALARSLVLEPRVLLLDEPLGALDPNLRKQVRTELRDLQRRTGITFIMVSHDREEALSMSDRIALLNAGRLEQLGTPEDLYLRPRTRFAATFLGPVNWIGGIGVRPEAMRVSATASAGSLTARVESAEFLGPAVQLTLVTANGHRITAEAPKQHGEFAPGAEAHVSWSQESEIKVAS
jgi:ABC-type Fe3+/spermidine/putrescine transport system ATPase subunit